MHQAMGDMANMDFSLIGVVIFGFGASFGHCIGMCSPIVVAYSSAKLNGAGRTRQIAAHALYALGRTTIYALLGLIFGLIGSVLTPSPNAKAIFLLALGAAMIAIGFALFFGSRLLAALESDALIRRESYNRVFGALIRSRNMASFYAIGALNGLLPCGMVYAALAMALSAGSAIGAAGAMAAFGLATAPSLFAIGLFAAALVNSSLRGIVSKIAAVFVIVMGCWTLYRALAALLA
jgi:sulfite exporter TauE/SafE